MAKNYLYMKWGTVEDKKLLDMRKRGMSLYKIAYEPQRTVGSVKAQYYKIKPKQTKKEINRSWNYII